MSKINHICKWTVFAISNFTIIEKMASRNSSEVVYIGDLSRHWIISKGTQIPKGIGWYKLKPATKPTMVVQSKFIQIAKKKIIPNVENKLHLQMDIFCHFKFCHNRKNGF